MLAKAYIASGFLPSEALTHDGPRRPKAIVLLSGGLDSTLALHMMKEMGVDVVALSFKTPFCNFDCGRGACGGRIGDTASKYGVEWRQLALGEEYLEMVREPKHGYGSAMNPCIDCRVMMFRRAKEVMKEVGADFVVTGEVLGQRPMSQNRRAMQVIEKESGLEGLILRPLSARLFEPTLPERMGWVDREKLLAIHGRSRRVQMSMAKEVGWRDYPNPGGGCLLTEAGFARRLRDLLSHVRHPDQNDVDLLKVGRHFRIDASCKLVVGRNELENDELRGLTRKGDLALEVVGPPGPLGLLRGSPEEGVVPLAAEIVSRYSDAPKDALCEVMVRPWGGEVRTLKVKPAAPEDVAKMLI